MNFRSTHEEKIKLFDELFPALEKYFFKKRHASGEVQNLLMKANQEADDILYVYRRPSMSGRPSVSGPAALASNMGDIFKHNKIPTSPPTKWQVLKFLFLKITLEAYSKLYEISSFGEIYYRTLFHEIRQWSYVHPMDYKMNNHTLDMKTAFENNDDVALVILRNRNLLNSHTKKWLSRYFDRLEQPEKYDNNARAKKGYVECYNIAPPLR